MPQRHSDMSRIIDIGPFLPRVSPAAPAPAQRNSTNPSPQVESPDIVEFSQEGRALSSQMHDGSILSVAKAAAIRSEIASGGFETPERMKGTIDRLLDVIG